MNDWELRPARDLDLPLAARLRSHRREMGLSGLLAGSVWRSMVQVYLAAAHRFEIIGLENLPAEPPFVLIGNHSSHLDALCLGAALPGRLAHRAIALAAGDVFFGSVASAAFAATALNAMPIWRKQTSRDDLAYLRLRLLEDRQIFVLFPEGTRTRSGEIGRFRPGLGGLVAASDVPVVPCYLDGAFRCWPSTRKLPRPGKLSLRIGPALSFPDLGNDRQGWATVAASAEQAVRSLATGKPSELGRACSAPASNSS